MGLFDVHAHLTDSRLAAQEAQVLERAASAGLSTIISNGLNPSDNAAVAALARRSELVKPAFGLYPVDAVLPQMLAAGVEYPRTDPEPPCTGDEGVAWVRDHVDEAIAVGEIGLDRYWVPKAFWEEQERIFRALVTLAMEANKPIIVHSRKAEARMFEVLTELGATRVNWHCYSSKVKLGQRIGAHGHYLSMPANARRVDSFRQLIETLPRDRVLLETDCPYLPPERDGSLNEPSNVTHTLTLMAELWKCTEAEVTEQLESNFETLFGVPP